MKKKKFYFPMLLMLCFLITLCGCGTTKPQEETPEEEPQYADDTFVQDMAKGLETRWDLSEKDEQKEGYENITVDSEEYKTMMLSYIDSELNVIEHYTEEKFEDKNLQEIALKYINLLKKHKEICGYMTVDYVKYNEEAQTIYNERSKIISTMADDYNMVIDEKYQSILNDFAVNSQLVNANEEKEEKITAMLDGVQFQESSDNGGGWKTYQAVVENTTGIDFKTFCANINLINADDVIVETAYYQVSAFNNGTKAQFEFSTDKEFDSTQVVVNWYEE